MGDKTSRTFISLTYIFLVLVSTASSLCPAAAERIQLELEHGTYVVPVRINGSIILPFVLDTGASEVSIPADVFLTLTRTKTVTMNDFIGVGTYILADGSEQPSERFILHELRVGDHIIRNVVANVAPIKGDPLLGQSFLSKLPAWTIDNAHHALVLNDEAGPVGGQQLATVGVPTPQPQRTAPVPTAPTPPNTPSLSADVRYRKAGCGSIIDTKTDLEWYVGPDANISWLEATQWVRQLPNCGGGWRLPNLTQLKTLFDQTVSAGTGYFTRGEYWPAHIDPAFSAIGGGSWVWADGVIENSTAPAVNFNQGIGVRLSTSNTRYTVRAFAVKRSE